MPKSKFAFPSGATPIDPDEVKELIPDYLSTFEELNQLEQSNIADAFVWVGKQDLGELLTATFILKLHGKMFDRVWKWAGKTCRSNKNIGVTKERILDDLGQLLGNTQYWIENKTFPPDEIAARFHHRLVQIHIFPNGNGRHARLMTDPNSFAYRAEPDGVRRFIYVPLDLIFGKSAKGPVVLYVSNPLKQWAFVYFDCISN